MVHLGRGANHSRGSAPIRTLDRGDALGEWGSRATAIGRGARHRAKVDVYGGRKQVDAVASASGVGSAVHRVKVGLEYLPHDAVGVGIVIPVLGRPIQQTLLQPLLAREIVVQCAHKLRQRHDAVVVHL